MCVCVRVRACVRTCEYRKCLACVNVSVAKLNVLLNYRISAASPLISGMCEECSVSCTVSGFI